MKVNGLCPRCGAEIEVVDDAILSDTILVRDIEECRETSPELDQAGPQDLSGKEVGVYRCEALLGSGGMGRVYLANHRDLHRLCALKILSERVCRKNPGFVDHFLHEGRSAAALSHPNIVTIHAVGQEDGKHFLEMEFLAGGSLQRLIDREHSLTVVRATRICLQVAQGLAAAHQRGIIHRDLKLDNVMLTQQGVPKITDFGLAKRVLHGTHDDQGPLMGTPHYMAPELFAGQPAHPGSDVYALGVCYYLLLSGELPFVGRSLPELQKRITENPVPNVRNLRDDVPLEMAECLSLLLAKSPANRPHDGIEATQLLAAVGGQIRDIESILVEAFGGRSDVSWTRTGNRYELNLILPDGRKQKLFIEPSQHSTMERLLLIYSICCDALPEFYEEALRLNAEIPHGGLSLREIDGHTKFVMVDTFPRSSVDAEDVRKSAYEVAYRADAIEKQLTGLDVN